MLDKPSHYIVFIPQHTGSPPMVFIFMQKSF